MDNHPQEINTEIQTILGQGQDKTDFVFKVLAGGGHVGSPADSTAKKDQMERDKLPLRSGLQFIMFRTNVSL